jgi:hypothetical protein
MQTQEEDLVIMSLKGFVCSIFASLGPITPTQQTKDIINLTFK